METLLHANLDRQGGMLPKRWNLTDGQPLDGEYSSSNFMVPKSNTVSVF